MKTYLIIAAVAGSILATLPYVHSNESTAAKSADCWSGDKLIFSGAVDTVKRVDGEYWIAAPGITLRTNAVCAIEYSEKD